MKKFKCTDRLPPPGSCSPEAADLLSKLLKHEPDERIGCWEGGALDVKQHPFFRGIDWDALLAQEVVPPFIPPTRGLDDVQNISPEFLSQSVAPLNTPAENDRLKQQVKTLDSTYSDFHYINSHNLILSPKRDTMYFAEKKGNPEIEKTF